MPISAKPNPRFAHTGAGAGLLVEPRGEADQVREARDPELLHQPRVVHPQAALHERPERRCSGEHGERRHRDRVGAFGFEPEEKWPHDGPVDHAPESWSACRASAMSFSVIPPWLWVASVTVTRFHEITRSGWWSAASAASARRFTKPTEPHEAALEQELADDGVALALPSGHPGKRGVDLVGCEERHLGLLVSSCSAALPEPYRHAWRVRPGPIREAPPL